MKGLLIGLFVLGGVLAAITPVIAQDAPPATEQTKAVENLVNKAATLIDKDGKAAFAEFRKKDSAWFHGDTYLFAYDMKANVLLNPAFPQRDPFIHSQLGNPASASTCSTPYWPQTLSS